MSVPNNEYKIIVVDDSNYNRKAVVEILEEYGYNVCGQAGSAEEAIKTALSIQCDLMIIDLVMPHLSGIEIIKHISEKIAGISYIIMSSLESESIIIESISGGAEDFLQKPFTKDDLLKAVAKIQQDDEQEEV